MIPTTVQESPGDSAPMSGWRIVMGCASIGAFILLTGCNTNSEKAKSEDATPEHTAGESILKLYAFDCGRLNYDSIAPLGIADNETDVRDLIVPCYVVEHPKGRLLWEGGLPSDLVEVDGWQEMAGGWRMRLDQSFSDQIAQLGYTTSDFDYIAFSHFHFDHIGTANEMEGATLLIQRPEYEAAFADSADVPGYYNPLLYYNLKASNKVILDEMHDVFDDGRVLLIPTPGHTSGHQSLYLDLANTGPIVLSGDLHIFRTGHAHMRVPPFNVDSAQTIASMKAVEDLLERKGATLWIGHDLARFNELKKPPLFQD